MDDALSDPRADVRRRAVLAATDPAAVLAALRDPVWCVREAAVIAAGPLPDPDGAVLAALVACSLQDSSPHARAAAAASAGPRVQPAREYGAAIGHRFERQRARAALALGFVAPERAPEAVALLAAAANDSHAKVRLAALRTLARLDPRAVVSAAGIVVRKCAEAEPDIADAARAAWEQLLTAPAAAALRPLAPFPGSTRAADVRRAVGALPEGHPLRRAWELVPLAGEGLTAHRFARHLAAVCGRALA